MPLSKPKPQTESEQSQAPIPSTSVHFIGPTKPILKLSPAQTPTQTPARLASPTPEGPKHAHFPPPGQEPTARYSGVDYDRSPIIVLPNICALPERGCPGKTYFQDARGMHLLFLPSSSCLLIDGPFPPATDLSSSASLSTTNPAARTGNHAHPAKLLKKTHRPSPPSLSNVPSSVPPALTHSDTTSSDDYDSDETYPRPLFPIIQPDTVVYPGTERERTRKTSGSSEVTLLPTSRCTQGRTGLGLSIGRRAWNSTNESSEDDCLGGF